MALYRLFLWGINKLFNLRENIMGTTAVGIKKGPEKVMKGYRGKGQAKASAGQIDVNALTAAPTASIAFGVADKKAVVMRKKKATGWEYEQVDPDNIESMKTENYEIVASAKATIRTLSSTVSASAASQSKILHAKLNANLSYQWSQPIETYNKVGAGSRTKLAQVDGPVANADERVTRASGFILNTEYAGIQPGVYIPLNGIKARYRYGPAVAGTDTTPGSSGVYTSFAGESAWAATT